MSRRGKFFDSEYRAGYAESFLDSRIATQIRVLREQRGWTQAQLAEAAGMKQSRICALEDANYSSWSVTTLKRLARAFDVPLDVEFGTFGRLLREASTFNRESLQRPEFAKDPAFALDRYAQSSGMDASSTAEDTAQFLGQIVGYKPRPAAKVLLFEPPVPKVIDNHHAPLITQTA